MRPQIIALNLTFTICWVRPYPLTATFWRYAQDTYISIAIYFNLERFLSCVCPSGSLQSMDGRGSWRFTGTQLWYTCDSYCRRRTMITRTKTNGSSTMRAMCNLEHRIKYQSSPIGIIAFDSYQTKAPRIEQIEREGVLWTNTGQIAFRWSSDAAIAVVQPVWC